MTITGVLLIAVGIVAIAVHARQRMNYWSIVNLVAGLWLLVSIQREHQPVMVWSNIVLGATAIVTALVSIAYARTEAGRARGATDAVFFRIVNYVPLINIVIGVVTIAAPYANHASEFDTNLTATGGVLIVVGALALAMQALRIRANYFSGISVLVGLWLLVSLGWETAAPALLWPTALLAVIAIITGCVALPYEHASDAFLKHAS